MFSISSTLPFHERKLLLPEIVLDGIPFGAVSQGEKGFACSVGDKTFCVLWLVDGPVGLKNEYSGFYQLEISTTYDESEVGTIELHAPISKRVAMTMTKAIRNVLRSTDCPKVIWADAVHSDRDAWLEWDLEFVPIPLWADVQESQIGDATMVHTVGIAYFLQCETGMCEAEVEPELFYSITNTLIDSPNLLSVGEVLEFTSESESIKVKLSGYHQTDANPIAHWTICK